MGQLFHSEEIYVCQFSDLKKQPKKTHIEDVKWHYRQAIKTEIRMKREIPRF